MLNVSRRMFFFTPFHHKASLVFEFWSRHEKNALSSGLALACRFFSTVRIALRR